MRSIPILVLTLFYDLRIYPSLLLLLRVAVLKLRPFLLKLVTRTP